MSLKVIGVRVWQAGRALVSRVIQRGAWPNLNQNVGPRLVYEVRQASHASRLVQRLTGVVSNSMAGSVHQSIGRRPGQALVAFAGFVLVSPKDKEQYCGVLCDNFRKSVMQQEIDAAVEEEFWSRFPQYSFCDSVDHFDFGNLIAKGCNAAVYEARLKERFAHLRRKLSEESVGLEAVSDWATCDSEVEDSDSTESDYEVINDIDDRPYDCAIKMMFNYDVESNVGDILEAMKREIVPARLGDLNTTNTTRDRVHVPRHPNIVDVWRVFADVTPLLPDALTLYPDALPLQHNPDGFGRAMTLFLVMKRYDVTLRQYLSSHSPPTSHRLMILAQLLEGVLHLTDHHVAHRDIKTDNILVTLDHDDCPHVVIADFGCCLTERDLQLPYNTCYTDKGGNFALMAPEIACTSPGVGVTLHYDKADLWALGAVAYEIFGQENPFYGSSGVRLNNKTYSEDDLPSLPDDVPPSVCCLVRTILSRDALQRPSVELSADILQVVVNNVDHQAIPVLTHHTALTDWLLTRALQTAAASGATSGGAPSGNPAAGGEVARLLLTTFLGRCRPESVWRALCCHLT